MPNIILKQFQIHRHVFRPYRTHLCGSTNWGSVELIGVTRVLKAHSIKRRKIKTWWKINLFYTLSVLQSAQPNLNLNSTQNLNLNGHLTVSNVSCHVRAFILPCVSNSFLKIFNPVHLFQTVCLLESQEDFSWWGHIWPMSESKGGGM